MKCLEVEIINLKSDHLLKFRQVILSLCVSISLMNYNPLSGSWENAIRKQLKYTVQSTSVKVCKGFKKSKT